DVDRVRCGHRVNLLRLTWSSFEESRDDRPLPGYDTPPHVTSSYTTSLDATPATPLPIAPLDTPDTPTLAPSATPGLASSSGGASPLPDFAHDLADAGKKAGEGLLAGIVILGSILAGGASPGGQFAR
ncbi:hypothetical protein BI295_07650, partial [Mycobacterium avium subsp. hominissuis]